jgi:hypothetical protein
MPVENKRKIAKAFVEKFVIGEGEIDITLSYLHSSEELCKNQHGLRRGLRAGKSFPTNGLQFHLMRSSWFNDGCVDRDFRR